MPALESVCPHCQTPLPALGTEARCPSCGQPVDAPAAPASGPPGRKRHPALSAFVGLAAVAIIGAACFGIYRQATREEGPADDSPEARAPGHDALDAAAFRSRVVAVRPAGSGQGAPVVVLARPDGPFDHNVMVGTHQGILAREIARQAVLIAARDGLGLATRDVVLGDAPPADSGSAPVEVVTLFRYESHQPVHRPAAGIYLTRGAGRSVKTVFRHDLPLPSADDLDEARLVVVAEALSRDELPAVLKAQLGVAGKPNPVRQDGAVPADVERRLDQMSDLAQFAAVRRLHDLIRTEGESPQRLGALARGYAHLGVLTEFHWNPAHKVFKARALLYAQRIAARDAQSPWGLWHRAYAKALAGLHGDALADLAEADKRAAAGGAAARPGWVELVDACCHYDAARLAGRTGEHAQLASLLRLMTLEYPTHSAAVIHAAKDVLGANPECFRAHDVLCQASGVAGLHVATTVGPQVLDQIVPKQVRALAGLPATVRESIDRQAGERSLVDALVRAGAAGTDPGEPSWSTLGQFVRETRFVQVWRRLYFMKFAWSVPTDEEWAAARPLTAGHPFQPFLEKLVGPPQPLQAGSQAMYPGLNLSDLELTEVMTTQVAGGRPTTGVQANSGFMVAHIDPAARDLSAALESSLDETKRARARRLLKVSPHAPFGMATLIARDAEGVRHEIPAWEKSSGGHPTLLAALARHATEQGDRSRAEEYLKRYIALSPDYWAYEMLAGEYKSGGDRKRWKATLEAYLDKEEDNGLEHAKARFAIANDCMSLAQYNEAWPYAEAAAKSYAHWAMDCAVRCAEARRDWENAELWVSRIAQRYPATSWADWFLFCKRTGHGNTEAARAFTQQYLASVGDRPDLVSTEQIGFFHLLEGDRRGALDVFQDAYENRPEPLTGFMLALLADATGDAALRDKTMKELETRHAQEAPRTVAVFRLFREALDKESKEGVALDLPAVDKILDDSPEERRGNTAFMVALFLQNRGNLPQANDYWKRCADSQSSFAWMRAVALDALRGPTPKRETKKIDPRSAS